MKRKATYIMVCVLALLVFYGGAGVNLITYCCGDCQTEGLAVLLEEKCCEIHEHNHCDTVIHTDDDSCKGLTSETDCCDVDRIDFDWNTFQSHLLNLQPQVVDIPSFLLACISLVPDSFVKLSCEFQPDDPPVRCPKSYLTLLTTLII